MAEQINHSLLRSNKYKLSVIIILLLASFIWLFFSFKILQNKPKIELIGTSPQNESDNLIPDIEKIADLQPRKNRSRNRENSQSLTKKESQEYIEALRESFEKIKPTQNNIILRGEITPSKQKLSDTQSTNTNIETLLNDELNLKTLNTEYQRALEDINKKPQAQSKTNR